MTSKRDSHISRLNVYKIVAYGINKTVHIETDFVALIICLRSFTVIEK